LEVLVELDLWLVNPSSKSVLLIFYLFKELIIASTILGGWGSDDRSLPPRMSFKLVPIDPVNRILLEHLLNQIVKFLRKFGDYWYLLHDDLLDKILQRCGVKWWFTCSHFNQDATKGPKV
jgi:hypothetical protein